MVRVRMRHEHGGEPGHAEIAQERDDVACAGVGAAVGRSAGVHQHRAAIREPQQRRVSLTDGEEQELEPAPRRGRGGAQVCRREEARRGERPRREPARAARAGGDRGSRVEADDADEAGRADADDREPRRRGDVGDGEEGGRERARRHEESGGQRGRGRRRQRRERRGNRQPGADGDGGDVREEPEDGELAEVQREHGRGGERRGGARARAADERLEEPGAPGASRCARDREGAAERPRPGREAGDRGERELERDVERAAGIGGEEHERGERERVRGVRLALGRGPDEDHRGGDRRAQHRRTGAGRDRVHARQGERGEGGDPARVHAGGDPIQAKEDRAEESLEPERDDDEVQARDGEDVRKPAPRERRARRWIEPSPVPRPDRSHHPRLTGRKRALGRLGGPLPPPLEPARPARRAGANDGSGGESLVADPARREPRAQVAPARVPRLRRSPDRRPEAHLVAQPERPRGRGREHLESVSVRRCGAGSGRTVAEAIGDRGDATGDRNRRDARPAVLGRKRRPRDTARSERIGLPGGERALRRPPAGDRERCRRERTRPTCEQRRGCSDRGGRAMQAERDPHQEPERRRDERATGVHGETSTP